MSSTSRAPLLHSNGNSNEFSSASTDAEEEHEESTPEVDIIINNVVCSFSVGCHLNLREIATKGVNVEYKKENGMVTMKLRRPYTTASMWSSGKVTCTGANSEDQAKVAARRYARKLQKLGFNVRFKNYRVVNVLGTCTLSFGIKITNFSTKHRERASYEPELHPGVTYKLRDPKATLKIFSTGSITVTAPSVNNVQAAVQHIYPLVEEFKKPKTDADIKDPTHKRRRDELAAKRMAEEKERLRRRRLAAAAAMSTSPSTSSTGCAPPRKKR